MLGTAVLFGTLPAVARRWRGPGTAVHLLVAGVVQSFFTPGLAQINRDWVPDGVERVWAMRAQTLCGDALVNMGASFTTPLLCAHGGYAFAARAFALLTGVYSVLWQCCMRARPAAAPAAPAPEEPPAAEASEAKAVEWRIFTLRPVVALILFCECSNGLHQPSRLAV